MKKLYTTISSFFTDMINIWKHDTSEVMVIVKLNCFIIIFFAILAISNSFHMLVHPITIFTELTLFGLMIRWLIKLP